MSVESYNFKHQTDSMGLGFLSYDAEPCPAHVRTLERIEFVAAKGFNDQYPQVQLEVVREIAYRVLGVALPNEEGLPEEMIAVLGALLQVCDLDETIHLVSKCQEWVKNNT